jgi:predicted dehydrogenase
MSKKLKYGVIGCGGCGTGKHLTSYALYPDDVEIVAVCDILPDKAAAAAERFAAPHVYTDYRAMLKKHSLDIVSVATPNAVHMPAAVAALRAGAHVHCEKPLALNEAEAQAIVDARDAAGRKVMVGLNNRFSDQALFARRYIDEGHLGEIYHAKCAWRRRRGIPGKGGWFTTKALSGGGPMIDLGVHFFDLTMYLLGWPEPAAVSAATYCKFGNDPTDTTPGTFDVEDMATGFVKLAGGISVGFEFSWASNIAKEATFFELYGTKGGMRMQEGELAIFSEVAGEIVDVTPAPRWRKKLGWGEREVRHFIDCIRDDTTPMPRPEEAVLMMRIIDAIYTSAASGREVAFDPAIA